MSDRYPGYDVLAKRNTPSWNDQTRRAIDARMAIHAGRARASSSDDEWPTVRAICERIVPQPPDRARPAPVAAMIDAKLMADDGDGYRDARMPPSARGVAARGPRRSTRRRARAIGARFHELGPTPAGRCSESGADGRGADRRLGRHAAGAVLQASASCTTSSAPITPTRRPGTRSASAALRARAATCGCNSTGATRGRRPRRGPAAKRRRGARMRRVG